MINGPHFTVDIPAFFEEKFTYYRSLSATGRKKFLKRADHILYNKHFIGRDGLYVTQEMRLLITACWVQVTFGLKFYLTEDYNQIHIYPGTFFSKQANHQVKGLTTDNGVIFISWPDFVEGYAHANNQNLGMHEITHAMLLSAAVMHNFDDFFSSYYQEFFDNTKRDFWDIRRGYPSYLRDYGGTNFVEFLAVSVEAFFENPADLKSNMPELYYNLSVLLRQDPLNTSGDYNLSRTFVDEIMYGDVDHGIPEEVLKELTVNPNLVKLQYFLIMIGSLVAAIMLVSTCVFSIVGLVVFAVSLERFIKAVKES